MRRFPLSSFLSLAVVGGLLAASCVPMAPPAPGPGAGPANTGAVCRVLRVVDGDTVDMTCAQTGPFRARLIGYDTPETFEPSCPQEARLGAAATQSLRDLVDQATLVQADLGGLDRYDRRLVDLRLDGRPVRDTLIAQGLALAYDGGRRPDWCARLG